METIWKFIGSKTKKRNNTNFNTIFKKILFKKIEYIVRPKFINGTEQEFYNSLKQSINENGLLDPLFLTNLNGKLKVLIGNNRMVICKELHIKIIPCIITQIGNSKFFLKGKELKTDKEIKNLFHLPNEVEVRRNKGRVDLVKATRFVKMKHKYIKNG